MSITRTLLPALLLCLPLAACGGPSADEAQSAAKAVAEATGTVHEEVKQAMDKARTEITRGNISLSSDGQPKAEITPDGQLRIEGREVPADAAQRRLLKEYRGHIEAIALAGMDVGMEGAKLGVNAATEALKGVFNGDADGIEKRINDQASEVEASAKRICDRLPAMLATQQALAEALPAFKPYATMDQSDITDCGK